MSLSIDILFRFSFCTNQIIRTFTFTTFIYLNIWTRETFQYDLIILIMTQLYVGSILFDVERNFETRSSKLSSSDFFSSKLKYSTFREIFNSKLKNIFLWIGIYDDLFFQVSFDFSLIYLIDLSKCWWGFEPLSLRIFV